MFLSINAGWVALAPFAVAPFAALTIVPARANAFPVQDRASRLDRAHVIL